MSIESDYTTWIESVLTQQGAWWVNIHGAGMGASGRPDLLVCLDGRAVGIEVKRKHNHPTISQCREGMRLVRAGGRFLVAYEDFEVSCLREGGLREILPVQANDDEFSVFDKAKTMKGKTYEMVVTADE